MNAEQLSKVGSDLVRRCGTRDPFQIARAMHTDINLIALKIAHLAETGHKLRRMEYRSSFLK